MIVTNEVRRLSTFGLLVAVMLLHRLQSSPVL